MKYLSVCSGIEAATVAWHHLGWTPAAFSEIEPFPSAVLAHHYPDVPNIGDMTRFKEWDIGSIDLLVGGTPCQSFSVAGLRKGLHDPRGGLMLTFLEIAQRYRPRWVVWENVPGVLSSNGGRDFGAFLGALGELGYGWAYRVLDAQWFGVAQRRRRVFVVGCLGDQASAAAVLFESESVCRYFEKSGKARQGFARGAEGGAGSGGWWDGGDVAATLTKQNAAGGQRMPDKDNFGAVLQPVAHTLRGEGFDAGEDGTGRGTPLVPVAFHPTQDPISSDDGTTHAMGCGSKQGTATVAVAIRTANTGANGHGIAVDVTHTLDQAQGQAVVQAVAFKVRGGVEVDSAGKAAGKGYLGSEETAFTLAATQDQWLAAPPAMQVRRLTPVECERLQGFPDNYTNIPWRKKDEAPDGPRYKALGNSMAVPCMRWIGERIAAATRQEVKS